MSNTRPPDAYLSLRTEPTISRGMNIMTMPNGTMLELIERRPDRWWRVRVFPTGQEGWALSGEGSRVWIECCVTARGTPAADENQQAPVGFRHSYGMVDHRAEHGVDRKLRMQKHGRFKEEVDLAETSRRGLSAAYVLYPRKELTDRGGRSR